MAWKIDFTPQAEKRLEKLDGNVRERILRFLYDRVAALDNPRLLGAALQGSAFSGVWKYRVGDYRVLARIHDDRIVIQVIDAGHRSSIYDR